MGPLDKFMLPDDALTETADGFNVAIRLHWYRSLPLSSIANIALKIDGENIAPEKMSFELNGKVHQMNELENLYKEWWFILDRAILHVHQNKKIKEGKQHEVELEFGLLLPYILVGPNLLPMLSSGKITKQLISIN
jgi:hypothetical protein